MTISIWNGVYSTWKEAESYGIGFRSSRWLERIASQLKEYRKDPESFPPRPSDLPLLCAATKSLSVLDFGGSSGWVFDFYMNSISDQTINNYTVLEISELVEFMQQSRLHENSGVLKYTKKIGVNERFDVLYTNSTLQYLGEDSVFFDLIKTTVPDYILLEDFICGDFDDFYTLQTYHDNKIPVKFRNKNKFTDEICRYGYKLILAKPYIATVFGLMQCLPMSNLPEKLRVSHGMTLFFKKNI